MTKHRRTIFSAPTPPAAIRDALLLRPLGGKVREDIFLNVGKCFSEVEAGCFENNGGSQTGTDELPQSFLAIPRRAGNGKGVDDPVRNEVADVLSTQGTFGKRLQLFGIKTCRSE